MRFSIIIPTLFRCIHITKHLINSLCEDPAISEIIIIDNTSEENSLPVDILFPNEKVQVYSQGTNLYVNPSWNLGVSLAKEENIALINDDVILPEYLFSTLSQMDFKQIGVLGACHPYIQQVDTFNRFSTDKIEAAVTDTRTWGYGICLVMHKSNYINIPEDMKVWCGDDYLFHQNRFLGRDNYMLLCPIQTKMSTTSDDPIFDDIKNNDIIAYNDKYKI